ncbi:MAG: exonuclease subunit SbcC [Bacteriovoracaceae bacterium]
MKFKSLTIKNLNSWQGTHQIDFEKILKNNTLFAITGPTGAGKSTVLLGLSLALYGKGPKSLYAHDYITLGEHEALVELTTTLKGHEIMAHWSIKHGQKQAKRAVLIDGKPAQRPASILEEMLGLNFDQFSKTIILNQGEFAKFLTSSFTERKTILEHLAGIDQLANIADTIKRRRNESLANFDQIDKILEALPSINETDLELKKNELETVESEIVGMKSQSHLLTLLRDRLKSFIDLSLEEEKVKNRIENINQNLKVIYPLVQEKKLKFENQKKINLDFDAQYKIQRPKLVEAVGIEKSISLNKEQLKTRETLKNIKALELTHNEKQQTELKHSIQNGEKETKKWETPLTHLEIQEKQKLQDWAHEITLLKQKIFSQQTSKSETLLNIERIKKVILNDQKKLESLDHSFKDKNLSELDQALFKAQDELGRLMANQKMLAEKIKEQDLAKFKLEELRNKRDALQEKLNSLHKQFKDYQLQQALELISKESKKLGYCLVCNGEATHIHDVRPNSVCDSQVIERLNLEQQQLEIEFKGTEHQIVAIENEIQRIKGESFQSPEDLNLKITALKNERDRLINFERISLPLLTSIKQNKTRLLDYEQKLELEIKNEETFKNQLTSCAQNIRSIVPHFGDNNESLLLDWLRADQNFIKAQSLLNQDKLNLKNNESQALKLKQELEGLNSEISQISEYIAQEMKNLEVLTGGQSPSALLTKLEAQQEILQTKLKSSENEYVEAEKKRDYEQTMLQSETFGLENLRLKIIETKTFISKTVHELYELNLISDEFVNLRKLTDPSNDWITEVIIEINDLIFTPYYENIKKKESSLIERRGEIKNRIQEIEKMIERIHSYREQFNEAKARKDLINELYDLVIKNDFRGYVLSFIEEALINLANLEIAQLCDSRYKLIQHKDHEKNQIEFMVIDAYHGGETRKISTLSGGETFLISLGLALALSEMMRGKTEIDSFFIDEGFGTLDPDSIDDVLQILTSVQNRGKTIGLISHVKNLTARIPINIELFRKNSSTDFKVIYN